MDNGDTFQPGHSEAPTVLRVRLFGGFGLSWGDRKLSLPGGRTACSLFAYLITYRDRAHTRDLLAGTFWPDQPDNVARRRLSQTLWRINQGLQELQGQTSYLTTTASAVQFNVDAPYWLDTEEFQKARGALRPDRPIDPEAEKNLRKAVDLYRGEFMAGYYDDWAILRREEFRDMALAAMAHLLDLYKARGAFEEALTYARRLVMEDPLREEGHREVMRLCYILGRSEEALQQYETVKAILLEELGVEPMEATTSLYREISSHSSVGATSFLPAASTLPSSPLLEDKGELPFVGRSKERATLVGYLEQAISGEGRMVLIEGEAGVGKTRLLQEVARQAEWRGMQVLWGHGQEMVELPPYGLLLEALRAGLSPLRATQLTRLLEPVRLRELTVVLPELGEWVSALLEPVTLEAELARSRLLEALTHMTLALGQLGPLLLILEDLQWADEASLEAIAHLAPRLANSHVLAIASYRPGEAREREDIWKKIQALDWIEGYRRLALGRLTEQEASVLVKEGLGLLAPAPRFESRIYQETEGNPLFIVETLRALYDEGVLYRDQTGRWSTPWDDTTADYAELPLPLGVYQVIARRLARLHADELAVLRAAAVLGKEVDFPLLEEVCQIPAEACLVALRGLVRRRLLEETPTAFQFSHDRIRVVTYQEMADHERLRLHVRAAEALERRVPDEVAALAYHFEQGQVWQKACHYHHLAGNQAKAVYAVSIALHHLDRALALADRANLPNHQRYELLVDHEAVLDVLGKREAQAADLAALSRLAHDDPSRLAQVYLRKGWLWTHLGNFGQATELARQSLQLFRQEHDVAGQVAALSLLGTLPDWQGRPAGSIAPLEEAIALCQTIADRRSEAKVHHALGSALLGLKDFAKSESHLRKSLKLYRDTHDLIGETEVLSHLGIVQMEQGNLKEAEDFYQQCLSICHQIGYPYGEAKALLNLGNVFVFREQTGRALDCYSQALALFRQTRSERGEALTRLNVASQRLEVLGDDEGALPEVRAALAYYQRVGDPVGEGHCLGVMGAIHRHQGNLSKARRLLEEGLEKMQGVEDHWIAVQIRAELSQLLLDQGAAGEALSCIREAEAVCKELDLSGLAVTLLALRGVALLAMGRPEEALAATAEAVSKPAQGIRRRHLLAYWHYQVLQALGRTKEAASAIDRAHSLLRKSLESLSPKQQQMSLRRVRVNRAIVAAWEKTQDRSEWRLPRVGAPTGRPLRDDEWVKVVWTIEAPEDREIANKVARRRHRLLRLLHEARKQGGAPTVDDLAAALQASRATIKRDLAALRKAGHEVRTRGSRLRVSTQPGG